MKITALKPAVKTAGRWNIFVDGSYAFSLDESQVVEHHLKVGQDITDEQRQRLESDSLYGKAYARALDYVLRRWRSRRELEDYARRKQWEPAITQRVLDRLEERGYIDDRRFAESWVRSRAALKPSSQRKLTLELRQKGVAVHIIEAVLAAETELHDEQAALRRMVEKKQRLYADEQKLIAYLMRQGFRYDAIKSALTESH